MSESGGYEGGEFGDGGRGRGVGGEGNIIFELFIFANIKPYQITNFTILVSNMDEGNWSIITC